MGYSPEHSRTSVVQHSGTVVQSQLYSLEHIRTVAVHHSGTVVRNSCTVYSRTAYSTAQHSGTAQTYNTVYIIEQSYSIQCNSAREGSTARDTKRALQGAIGLVQLPVAECERGHGCTRHRESAAERGSVRTAVHDRVRDRARPVRAL